MPPYRTVGIHQGTSGTKPAVFGGIGPGAAPTGASAEHIALLRRAAFGLMTGRIRVPTASQGTASKAMMPRSKDAQPGLAVYTVAASPVQAPYSSPAEASDAWQQPPPSTTQRCISAAFHLVLDNTDKHYQEGTRHVPNMYVNTWSALLKAAVFVWPVDLATSAAQVLKAIFRLSFKAGWQLLKSLLDILVNMCRKGTLSKLLSLNSPSAAYCKTADPGFAASHRSPASLSGQPRLTVQQTSAPFDMPTYIPARQPLPAAQLFDNVRGAWPPSPMPACLALGLCCAAQVHLDRLPATGDRLRQVLDSNFGIKSVLMPNFQSDSRSQLGQLLPSVEDTNARSQYARSQCARSQHALSQPSTRSAPDAASAPVPTWLQLQHSSTHEVPDAFDWSSVSIGARSQLHPASLPVPAKQLPQVLASGYNGSPTWSTEAVPNQVAARIPLPAAQLGAVLAETVPPKLSWLDLATTQPPQAVPITQPLRVDHLLETIPENGPVSDDGSCWTDTASDMSVSDNRSSQSDTDLDAVLAADYELPRDDKPGHTRGFSGKAASAIGRLLSKQAMGAAVCGLATTGIGLLLHAPTELIPAHMAAML